MPRIAKELSALAIKNLEHSGKTNKPERHNAGGVAGLLLSISPNNAKSWVLRVSISGKRTEMGLGAYPETSLKDARERASKEKLKIREGLDPLHERKVAKAALAAEISRRMTFSEAAEKYLEHKLTEFKNEKHKQQWGNTLDKYAKPVIGAMPVGDIDVHDVLRVLKPIWEEKNETASRVRGRIEKILAWATVMGYRKGDNAARWQNNLSEALPAPSKIQKVTHQPAVHWSEASSWFQLLKNRDGIATRALEFLILTASRSGEVRGAVWDEMDLENQLWIIPANRMKMKREHRVPLSEHTMKILENAPRFEGSKYVFPAARGGMLSDMAMSACMRRIHAAEIESGQSGFIDRQSGKPAVPHGLRSTFRDWAGEKTDYPREIIELCLAHDIAGSVERAYRRGDILEKRRKIMSEWADFLLDERIC